MIVMRTEIEDVVFGVAMLAASVSLVVVGGAVVFAGWRYGVGRGYPWPHGMTLTVIGLCGILGAAMGTMLGVVVTMKQVPRTFFEKTDK